MFAKNTPNLIVADISQFLGHPAAVPLAVSLRWISIQQGENSFLGLLVVGFRFPRPGRIFQAGKPILPEPPSPLGHSCQTRL